MAEVVGLASGIASLVTIAMKITELSYRYIADIRSAPSTQKQYLREVSALTDVLLRSEEVCQNLEKEDIGFNRPNDLSQTVVAECTQELEKLCSELRKLSPSIFWPIREKSLKKHVADLHRFRGIFADFLSAQALAVATATHRNVIRLANHQDQAELLEWLGNPKETSRPVPSPLPDTGAWFLNSEAYKQWTTRSKLPPLWCYGPPGVGKSMLAAVAIQDLDARSYHIPALHYFFDFGNREEQVKETIWKDLLRQIIAKGSASTVQKLVNFRKELGFHRPASSKDFSDALKIACANQQFVLALDGPDEMENPRELKTILIPFTNARVLVTSRDTPEIRSTLNPATAIEVQADAKDMRAYVASRFGECDLDDLTERHPQLENEILDKSQGIFLLVRLLVDQLVDLSTVKEMRIVLQVFPTHLDEAFESSLRRINAQSKSRSALAHRVMGWIVSAERKLQMSELAHGLATEEGVDVIDEENLVSSKTILKVCGGLVVLQGSAVSMVHTTVHTWLRNRYDGRYHGDLAESCLRYLTMRSFSSGVAQTVNEMDTRLSAFPFFSYAAQNWRRHLSKAGDARPFQAIDQLLDDSSFRSAAFQGANYKNSLKCPIIRSAAFESMPRGQSALHFASYWNLPAKIEKLLPTGEERNSTDTQMWTPLHWACFAQSQEAVQALVSQGVDTNAKDSVGWTPLFWTALNGDAEMVMLLLQSGARHTEHDIYDWTALRWAVASLKIDVAKVLLEHHSNTLSQSHDTKSSSTIKHLSFDQARAYLVSSSQMTERDLIDDLEGALTGSDENTNEYANEYDDLLAIFQQKTFDIKRLWTSGHFDPPVGDAWRTSNKINRYHMRQLELHINAGYDLDHETTTSWKSRMLQSAIKDGKLLAVRLLLEAGADVNREVRQRGGSQTPLHAATLKKDVRFAEILINYGAHMETHNHDKVTPLQQAVANGFEEVTRLLLSNGANVNVRYVDTPCRPDSTCTRTPLMIASSLRSNKGDVDLPVRMISMLLGHGADPNIKDSRDDVRTALHYAVVAENPRALKLLLGAGSNLDSVDKAGRVEFHKLLYQGESALSDKSFGSERNCIPDPRIECLTILAQSLGRDFLNQKIENKTGTFCTPLSLAAVLEDWEMFQALHNLGADFETNAPLEECLTRAIRQLQLPAIKTLIENGATISRSDGTAEESNTGYWWIGYIYLFSQKADITSDEGSRFEETMKMLTSHGFDIDATDDEGCTLLHHAAQRGPPEIFECLLRIGANPYHENKAGIDSFLLACLHQKLTHLEYLLIYTGKHNFVDHWGQHFDLKEALEDDYVFAVVSKALKTSGKLNKWHGEGTLISEAASLDNWAFVEELLVCGAGSNAQVLHLAVEKGQTRVVKLLVDSGTDIGISDERGQTTLHLATKNGHISIVKLLIDAGADVNVSDEWQDTPLHIAAHEGFHELVDVILSRGAEPDAADHQGWRPLHFAAWSGHLNVARSLLQAGASAGATTSMFTRRPRCCSSNQPGRLHSEHAWTGTPLHLAAMSGSAETTRLILQENVDVNTRTDSFDDVADGYSPPPTPQGGPMALHIALVTGGYAREEYELDKGRLEIASMLIERGASIEGVANHLRLKDVAKFEDFPQLWDKLREGITATE